MILASAEGGIAKPICGGGLAPTLKCDIVKLFRYWVKKQHTLVSLPPPKGQVLGLGYMLTRQQLYELYHSGFDRMAHFVEQLLSHLSILNVVRNMSD